MTLFNVICGDFDFVSDEPTAQDAAAELFTKTGDGDTVMPTISVVDILTGEKFCFETSEIMNELGFEWED